MSDGREISFENAYLSGSQSIGSQGFSLINVSGTSDFGSIDVVLTFCHCTICSLLGLFLEVVDG